MKLRSPEEILKPYLIKILKGDIRSMCEAIELAQKEAVEAAEVAELKIIMIGNNEHMSIDKQSILSLLKK